jgi:phosphomannomutase
MNCDVSGVFAHAPEPVPEHLVELAGRVHTERADLGIAVDPDADRLVLVTEQGEPFGEEYTIASAVKFVLEKEASSGRRHRVVVNLSTTRAVEDIAALHGAEVLRTPVGEINVAKLVKSSGAIIGGEGSGGVILPAAHLGRDSLVGIALILQMLAEFGGPISKLKTAMPRYSIAKGKIDARKLSPDTILEKVRSVHDGAGMVNNDDGLKIDYPDYWVHLRKSNTEPIIRIIAEAKTMERATAVVQEFRHLISSFRGLR